MTLLFDTLTELAASTSIWIYLIIFFGKLLEVSTSTLRIVLINRGIRLVGSLLAILEITLWLIITSTVLSSFRTDPLKMLVYAVAFGMGNFLGSWLDERLAFGLSSVQIVVPDMENARTLSEILRDNGFGISSVEVRGIDNNQHYMLWTMIRRKLLKEVLSLITTHCSSAVISVSDVKTQKGGFIRTSPVRSEPHHPFVKQK